MCVFYKCIGMIELLLLQHINAAVIRLLMLLSDCNNYVVNQIRKIKSSLSLQLNY